MTAQRLALLIALGAAVAGCSDGAPADPSVDRTGPQTPAPAEPNPAQEAGAMPVRIGQLGPSFPACYAVARLRDALVGDAEAVPVRAGPFDGAREVARIGIAGDFFICGSSHDQRWFAIVWDESGAAAAASPACGVSGPSSRRIYDGPCRSGWIASAPVRFESGVRQAGRAPAEPAANAAEPPPEPLGRRPAD